MNSVVKYKCLVGEFVLTLPDLDGLCGSLRLGCSSPV